MSPEEEHKNYVTIFGMEHLCSEERPRELGLFRLEKRYFKADFMIDFHCIKGTYKKERTVVTGQAKCFQTEKG